MDDLTLRKTTSTNPYEDYGAERSTRRVVGEILRFVKGEFLTGPKETQREVPLGTKLVGIMPTLGCGWQRWVNEKPTPGPGGVVADGFRLPSRHSLGDLDESLWEIDPQTGLKRDPWQEVHFLYLAPPSLSPVYTLISSSMGGVDAVRDVSSEYGKHLRRGGEGYPMFVLGVDAYTHKNPRIGRVKKPRFLPILSFVPGAPFDAALAIARGRSVVDPEDRGDPAPERLEPPLRDEPPPISDDDDYGPPGLLGDDDIPF